MRLNALHGKHWRARGAATGSDLLTFTGWTRVSFPPRALESRQLLYVASAVRF